MYMIVNEYHINKDRVHDIWNDCEHSQQNGNHFFKELRKLLDKLISRESSSPSKTPLIPESIEMSGSLRDHVQEKQKKKKKLSKPNPVQSSDLPEISTKGSCQNSSLDVSYDLIASIRKDCIEAKEAIHESE
ncbi:25209_t:CDS:2, partial [Dentiscutata erythropus]